MNHRGGATPHEAVCNGLHTIRHCDKCARARREQGGTARSNVHTKRALDSALYKGLRERSHSQPLAQPCTRMKTNHTRTHTHAHYACTITKRKHALSWWPYIVIVVVVEYRAREIVFGVHTRDTNTNNPHIRFFFVKQQFSFARRVLFTRVFSIVVNSADFFLKDITTKLQLCICGLWHRMHPPALLICPPTSCRVPRMFCIACVSRVCVRACVCDHRLLSPPVQG